MTKRTSSVLPALALLTMVVGGIALATTVSIETKVVPSASAESVMQSANLDEYPVVAYMEDSAQCGGLGNETAGCFSTLTPEIIYIARDLPASIERSVILHELAHYVQYKSGLELDECQADYMAEAWGANPDHSGYKDECYPS